MKQHQVKPLRSFMYGALRILMILVAALAGGIVLGYTVSAAHLTVPGVVGALVILVVVYYLAIALHECGHVFAGVRAGMIPRFVLIGPLRISWTATGRTISWERNANALMGLASLVPRDGKSSPGQLAMMIAGGPAVSLALAGILWPVARSNFLATGMPGPLIYLPWLFLNLALLSGFLGLHALVASRTGGWLTDGGRLRLLLRGGPAAQREVAVWSILGRMHGPERLASIPDDCVLQATGYHDGSLEECQAHFLAAAVFLDRGDVASAGRLLKHGTELMGTVPKTMLPNYYLEISYFEARYGNLETAMSAFGNTKGGLGIPKHSRLRTAAALSFAEGDNERAYSLASQGLHLLASRPEETGLMMFERRQLQELKELAGTVGRR